MGLSEYEASYHVTLIVVLVLAYGVVSGGIVLVYGWSRLRHYRRSAGFARHRWGRNLPNRHRRRYPMAGGMCRLAMTEAGRARYARLCGREKWRFQPVVGARYLCQRE